MSRQLICLISFVLVLSIAGNVSAGLVGHWKLDDGSGTVAADSSGNGNDGTITNAEWTEGVYGGALNFDAVGQIDVPPESWATIDKQLTVAFWLYGDPALQPMSQTNFAAFQDPSNNEARLFSCHVPWSNSTVYFDTGGTSTSGGYDRISKAATPEEFSGQWNHWIFTKDADAGEMKIYHNGVLWHSGTGMNRPMAGVTGFTISGRPDHTEPYGGLMDDVRLYDHVLSDVEILGAMAGKVWPYASSPFPEDGALHAETWVSLGWRPGALAASHDVYLGDNFDDVNDGLGDTFRGNQALDSLYFVAGFTGYPYPDGLVNGTTYYWRIDEVNEADPNSPWKSDVWSFWIPSKKAYEPVPANGAKFIDSAVTLSWTPGFEAVLHTVYFGEDYDTVANAADGPQQIFTEYSPGTLELNKTYYWRVDEDEGTVTHTGDVWSFKTLPEIPIADPNLIAWWKLDEGSGNTALDWSGHGNHAAIGGTPDFVPGYDGDALDFDGSTDFIDVDGQLVSGTFTLTMWIRPRDIPYSDGYYAVLHNDAWNAGSLHVHLRNTSSLINADINSGPATESTTVLQADRWYHCALTVTNEGGNVSQLYINGVLENSGSGGDGTPYLGPMDIGAYQNGASRHYHGLMDDIRVYDRVLTADEVKETMRGDPLVAWDPNPVNSSTPDIDSALPLTWSPGDKASQHDVYFGTDKAVVEDADASDTSGTYRGSQTGTSYTPPEGVEWGGGPYYWRIDENNNDGTVTKGRIWTFTVADFILVDDFESYNVGDNEIWFAWHDGLGAGAPGTPEYVPSNGTGSMIGDDTTGSYTEESIVHGGSQSMPYWYDNNKQGFNKYSEAELTLTEPRDWTKNEVKELSLWFRGYPASVGSFVEGPVGTFTMTGSGADIFGEADEFHFAYKMLTGAGSIIARVESVEQTDDWAKAGVMIRESLDAGSKFAAVYITPTNADGTATNGCRFQARMDTDAGADSDSSVATAEQTAITAPYWVKLERDIAGNFSGYYSSNGSTWISMAWNSLNIPMNSNVYVGLALTSHDDALTCEAVFSNVTITGTVGPMWANQDVGIESNAAEPLYVAVSNTAGQPAVVVHDDPAAATIDTWTEWVIPLQAFADQGIVLTNVDRIAIGLGTKGNITVPGGSGKMFFDDIRLYRLREAAGE